MHKKAPARIITPESMPKIETPNERETDSLHLRKQRKENWANQLTIRSGQADNFLRLNSLLAGFKAATYRERYFTRMELRLFSPEKKKIEVVRQVGTQSPTTNRSKTVPFGSFTVARCIEGSRFTSWRQKI